MRHKKLLTGLTIILSLLGLLYINTFVYPFTSSDPNFSDVERVFNKMQFPSDWQMIDQSENRGIAGRRCPIDSESACYHKSKTYSLDTNTDLVKIEGILKSAGCPAVSFNESSPIGGNPYVNYECSIEGLSIRGTLERGRVWTATFTVYSD